MMRLCVYLIYLQLRQPSLEVIGFPPALEDNTLCHRSNAASVETPPLASKHPSHFGMAVFGVVDRRCHDVMILDDFGYTDTTKGVLHRHHPVDTPKTSNKNQGENKKNIRQFHPWCLETINKSMVHLGAQHQTNRTDGPGALAQGQILVAVLHLCGGPYVVKDRKSH